MSATIRKVYESARKVMWAVQLKGESKPSEVRVSTGPYACLNCRRIDCEHVAAVAESTP